ncbi:hypothetical protein [Haloglycomyces albus]|uniref:hypothetical protein n=1 Tax=Haloglycomyces albus TaxID=526067 RepID=UPI00046CD9D0|nr:hypothetical protein [Haloglycomyces albus]
MAFKKRLPRQSSRQTQAENLDPIEMEEFEEILEGLNTEFFDAVADEPSPLLAESLLLTEMMPVENLDVVRNESVAQRLVGHLENHGHAASLLALLILEQSENRNLRYAAKKAVKNLRKSGVEYPAWGTELTQKIEPVQTIYAHTDDSGLTWLFTIFQRGKVRHGFFLALDEDFCGEILDIVPIENDNVDEVAEQMRAGTFLEGEEIPVSVEDLTRGRAGFYLTSAVETSMEHRQVELDVPYNSVEEEVQATVQSSFIGMLAYRLSQVELLSMEAGHGNHVLTERPPECPFYEG